MKITFVANYMNHHQLPFSLKMRELTNNNYTYIAMEPLAEERSKLGYEDLNMLEFIIRPYEGKKQYERAVRKILEDDMVIFGSCPDTLLEMRRDAEKPFIIYSERFFKKGTYRRFIPMTMKKIKRRILQFEGDKVSVICSSAYLPYDLSLMNAKFDTYKWGYFPKCQIYDYNDLLKKKSGPKISIVWVGRLIKLKHPDAPIRVISRLKKDGYNVELTIVGDGVLRKSLEKLVHKLRADKEIHFAGSVPSSEVRKYMEDANIFMFTSDYHEGWGAVMNEAMNSGCAVIASHAVGSVPFLIENRKNGLVYKSGDIHQLYLCAKKLIDNPIEREKMGFEAYKSIVERWNPEEAATRLYSLIEDKINNTEHINYREGPCSIATVIDPRKYGDTL